MDDVTCGLPAVARSVALDLESILIALTQQGLVAEQSLRRVTAIANRLARFSEQGLGVDRLAELTPGDVHRFVLSGTASGAAPVATMHLRRSVVRLLFRVGRQIGLVDFDPTMDLLLPRRTSSVVRPLDDEEIATCRGASLHTLTSTRFAAAWALAEATARTAEIPRITNTDVDLEGRRVWIAGSGRTVPRWGELSEWGVTQLRRHLDSIAAPASGASIVYRRDGSAESRQASSCIAIKDTLIRAGLGRECDVRPVSVAAWAGRQVFEETGRIEEVARRLGMRSLDRAAALVGLDWSDE